MPDTTFVVSFVAPARTGDFGRIRLRNVLTARAPSSPTGCLAHVRATLPASLRGARVSVRLDPKRLGGSWCTGTYPGKVFTLQSVLCRRGQVCPDHPLVRTTVGQFSLHVRSVPESADHTPPTFAGLQRAFACTPGPQRPGETIPFTLSWAPANDGVTPSSEIVYDIYYATAAGGENFSQPTWRSAPGATSFRTPGLPAHGPSYFVVRARDRAGNRDENSREQPGLDPCV
jgi:hypothetical protein